MSSKTSPYQNGNVGILLFLVKAIGIIPPSLSLRKVYSYIGVLNLLNTPIRLFRIEVLLVQFIGMTMVF